MAQITQHIAMKGDEPRIAGTGLKVRVIISTYIRGLQSLEEIANDHNLSLAQVHAAIACYYDNFEEFEAIETQPIDTSKTDELKQKNHGTIGTETETIKGQAKC